jgi:trehalose synthase
MTGIIAEEPVSSLTLDAYAALLGAAEIHELRALAAPLKGRRVQMVNSTAVGGGVAELLARLLPLMGELGLASSWDVMAGGQDFFEVTKAFHNALHGAPYEPNKEHFDIFRTYNERNRSLLRPDAEFVEIHDPQPAGLIDGRSNHGSHWIWRCHIDLSQPNQAVWRFLEGYVTRFDGSIFSAPPFARQLSIPQYLFYPSIDPLSDKNRHLEPELVNAIVERFGIDRKRPLLTQISRFDRLKDPVGVVRAYRIVKRYFDCQLALAGGSVRRPGGQRGSSRGS